MPTKPRKRPQKDSPVLKKLNRLEKRVEGLAHDLASLRTETNERFDSVRQELSDGLQSVRQEMSDGLQSVRREMSDGLHAAQQETSTRIQSLRDENSEKFANLVDAVVQRFDTLASQIADIEKRDAQFRSEMLTMMDSVLRRYELFDQEKTALGAGQDRLQSEISDLQASDHRQNKAIAELEGRVANLEAART